jgi:RsiW-degrading membrane proteinase PrsW (M82 family)
MAARGVNGGMSEPNETASQPEALKPVSDFVHKAAEEVRKQPVKSLVWAFFVGIFLTIFPVGRILSLITGIVFGLLRPVLLLLGLVKISEVISEKRK